MQFSVTSIVASLKQVSIPTGSRDAAKVAAVKDKLNLQPHIEGGYFVETDRAAAILPCMLMDNQHVMRKSSTTIYHLLDPASPFGAFHRNKSRTIHTLHSGRGRYVSIHADDAASPECPGGYGPENMPESDRWTEKARVETFVVSHDIANGERQQWIVDGGKYKSSSLLPDANRTTSEGLLISETVIPRFEYEDHDLMLPAKLDALDTADQCKEMHWLSRKT